VVTLGGDSTVGGFRGYGATVVNGFRLQATGYTAGRGGAMAKTRVDGVRPVEVDAAVVNGFCARLARFEVGVGLGGAGDEP